MRRRAESQKPLKDPSGRPREDEVKRLDPGARLGQTAAACARKRRDSHGSGALGPDSSSDADISSSSGDDSPREERRRSSTSSEPPDEDAKLFNRANLADEPDPQIMEVITRYCSGHIPTEEPAKMICQAFRGILVDALRTSRAILLLFRGFKPGQRISDDESGSSAESDPASGTTDDEPSPRRGPRRGESPPKMIRRETMTKGSARLNTGAARSSIDDAENDSRRASTDSLGSGVSNSSQPCYGRLIPEKEGKRVCPTCGQKCPGGRSRRNIVYYHCRNSDCRSYGAYIGWINILSEQVQRQHDEDDTDERLRPPKRLHDTDASSDASSVD